MVDKKKDKDDENFHYIVRIGNKDLNGERSVRLALADIKGIGDRLAEVVSINLKLDGSKRLGDLDDDQIDRLKKYVESKQYEAVPEWMVNHRYDEITGATQNLISTDLETQITDDINYMKKIKSYKGIRHEKGKKVRGQRTKSNGRKGLSVGVQRKKEAQ
ncbi:MAG: 30S ribosomal protein S13 [Thermoplasmatales archaeon]|nr:30S ribosomal protein S13 [Thermoplasmatales archaeon]MCW6169892.1 30S ribosomal protein S13 [Thermoplasmatales archaeon]